MVGDWDNPTVRLLGAGRAEDMANANEVFVVIRRHVLQSFPAELDYCTSPSPVRAQQFGMGMVPTGTG